MNWTQTPKEKQIKIQKTKKMHKEGKHMQKTKKKYIYYKYWIICKPEKKKSSISK